MTQARYEYHIKHLNHSHRLINVNQATAAAAAIEIQIQKKILTQCGSSFLSERNKLYYAAHFRTLCSAVERAA